MTAHSGLRLLPWAGPGGKPCYLNTDDPEGFMSRLADHIESIQLGMASELLEQATSALDDETANGEELRLQEITALTFRLNGGEGAESEFQVFGLGVTQSPFVSSVREVLSNPAALTTAGDRVSLLHLIRRWQELEGEHHSLLETYGSFLQVKEQHPRARYLLLIQSLEGLYAHENRSEDELHIARHKEKHQGVVEAIESCESLTSDHKKFIKAFLMKRPYGNLDDCLSDAFASLPGDVVAELAKTPLIQGIAPRCAGGRAVANALRTIRNALAHGSRGYPAHELDDVALILERVARAHLLRILGCSSEVQERVLSG